MMFVVFIIMASSDNNNELCVIFSLVPPAIPIMAPTGVQGWTLVVPWIFPMLRLKCYDEIDYIPAKFWSDTT